MVEWITFCEVTSNRLKRELKETELDFLQWVYHKYRLEEGLMSEEENVKL